MLVLVCLYIYIYKTDLCVSKGIRSKRVPPVFLEKNINKKSGLIRLAAVRVVCVVLSRGSTMREAKNLVHKLFFYNFHRVRARD
jgi:hypothetical protein